MSGQRCRLFLSIYGIIRDDHLCTAFFETPPQLMMFDRPCGVAAASVGCCIHFPNISAVHLFRAFPSGGAFALCCVLCSAGLLRLRAARWGWREREGGKLFPLPPLFRGQPNEEEGDSLGIKRGIGPSVGRSLGLSELLDARRESGGGGGGSGKVAQSFPSPPPLSRRRRSHIIPNKLLSKPGERGEIVGFRMH